MPWQLSGNGRSDWSTKLIRGLKAEAAAGFQSRRERCREPTPVTPQYAAFSTYKAARVHACWGCCGSMAARSACAGPDAVSRHLDGGSRERPAISNRRGGIPRGASKARMGGRPKYSDRSSLGRVQRGDDATVCEGAHRTSTRPYSLE